MANKGAVPGDIWELYNYILNAKLKYEVNGNIVWWTDKEKKGISRFNNTRLAKFFIKKQNNG